MSTLQTNLISPKVDMALTSIVPALIAICFALTNLTVTPSVIVLLYTITSYPHFAGSYDIAFSNPVFRKKNYFVLYLLPILIALLTTTLYYTLGSLDIIIHAIIVFLIWHYVKQSYGVSIWYQIRNKIHLSQGAKKSLLTSYLLLGVATIFLVHNSTSNMNFMGQYIDLANVPENFQLASIGLAFICFSISVYLAYKDNHSIRKILPVLTPFVSTSFWFLLIHVNPVLILLLPLFHGIQYAPFIHKANKSYHRTKLKRAFVYAAYCIIGYLAVYSLPRIASINLGGQLGGFLFTLILITINVHHYAIDSVLWRMRNKECRDLLGIH